MATKKRPIKSDRYTGVYADELDGGDLSYFVTYRLNGKLKKEYLGKKSEGITMPFCHQMRSEKINAARYGDKSPIVKHKRKTEPTFAEVAAKCLEHRELKPTTATKYNHIINALTRGALKDKRLSDITPDGLWMLKSTLKDEGKAPKTINNYLDFVKTVFAWAIDHEIYKGVNPCRKVTSHKVDNARVRYLSIDEIIVLKEQINVNPNLVLFVELSLSTGARLNTVMAIRKKDINLSTRVINLHNFKSKNDYKGFITDALLEPLRAHLKELKEPNDLILQTPSRSIERPLQRILNSLFNQGLDPKDAKNRVVVHTLRHTFASHLAIRGEPIYTIMKLLDHKDIKDTLRYAKLAPDNGLNAVKGLW